MNTIANPYIGPQPFKENERDRFFGRRREARDLLALVLSEQLVLFYAQSGAGKSSLVNTCLIPDLHARGFEIFTGRVAGDLPSGLQVENIYVFNLLRSLAPDDVDLHSLGKKTISEYLPELRADAPASALPDEEQDSTRHALIIDQFEELFSTHDEAWEKRDGFFQQLAQAMEDDPYLWVILVMREDFIASLDPYAYLVPGRFRRRYYMQRLERNAALEAIKKPVQDLRPYAEGVAEKLVDDLCSVKVYKPDGTTPDLQPGQYVEPVQLQVICFNLWKDLSPGGTQITKQDIQDVGDVNTSLGKYYADRVRAVADARNANERKIREWFGDKLISPGGIRNMVLKEPGKRSSGLENAIILALPDLIRAEQRGGATFYELTHDRLVEPIIENNKKWFDENLSPLQRQAALWIAQEQNESWLLSDQALAEVEQWAQENQDELTDTEKDFLEACRKRQQQIEEHNEAQRQKLEMAQKLAKEQERLAQEQIKSAEQARLFAEEQERFAKEQIRLAQRSRRFSIVAVGLLILALIAATFALQSQRQATASAATAVVAEAEAKRKAQEANDLAETARARELASLATGKADEDLALSILLSIEAYDITAANSRAQSTEAQSMLFENSQRSARLRGYLTKSLQTVDQFRFSPDGKSIAAVTKDGEQTSLTLWDLQGNLQSGLPLDDAVSQFFFSPDSKYLIWLNRDGFSIWDIKSKTKAHEDFNQHVGEVSQIVFDPDGESYASLGENGDVTLWDTKVAKTSTPFQSNVTAFSPDGKKFAVFDRSGKITVGFINAEAQEGLTIDQKPDSVTSLAFTQDGNFLAVATKDSSIVIWDVINNQETDLTYSVPGFPSIQMMTFRPDGNLVVFNPPVGTYIFDLNTGQPTGDPIPGAEAIFSPDGQTLAVLGNDADVTLYSTDTRKQIGSQALKGQLAVFNADGSTVALFNKEDSTITLINSETAQPIGDPLDELTSAAASMAFNKDGNLLAVGAEDGSIVIWDVNSRNVTDSNKPESDTSPVSSLAFSPVGQRLVAGRRNGAISTWDLNTKDLQSQGTGYRGYISSIGLNTSGEFLYSIARDGLALFDMNTLTPVGSIVPGQSVQFIADNKVVAVFDYQNSKIILLKTSDLEPIATIQGDFVQLSPKQGILITKDKDEKISLWSTLTGARLPLNDTQQKSVFISPNDKFVYALDSGGSIVFLEEISSGITYAAINGQRLIMFRPDDKLLVTSSTPGELNLMDPITGAPQLKEPIKGDSTIFSPDGKYMLVYSPGGGNPTIWDVTSLKTIGERLSPLNGSPISSTDGWTVALMSAGTTNLLDMRTGKLMDQPLQGYFAGFSQDGRILAVNSNSGIVLWDVRQNKVIGDPLLGALVELSSNGTLAAARTGAGNVDLVLWDTSTGNQIGGRVVGQSGPVGNVTFNKGGDFRATRDDNGVINLFGSPSGKYFPAQATDTLVFSPDEQTFAILSPDGSLTLWDIFAQSFADNTIKDFTDPIRSATLNSEANILAVSSEEEIGLWNLTTGTLMGNLEKRRPNEPKHHVKEPVNVIMSPSGPRLVSVNSDGSLSLWDTDTGVQVGEAIHEAFHLFSPDGRILVTNKSAGYLTFTLWDTLTGDAIGQPLVGDAPVFSNDGQFIAFHPSGQDTFTILNRVIDTQGVQLKPVGESITGSFHRFGLDGRVVISSRVIDGVSRYEVWETGVEERTSVSIPFPPNAGVWGNSQGDKVALFYVYGLSPSTNTYAYTFYSWDLEASRPIGSPITDINYPSLSPNNLFLATSVDKKSFVIWNLERGTKSQPIPGTSWQFSPDSRFVAATDNSGNTTLYETTGEMVGKPFEGYFWGFGGADSGQIIIRNYEEGGLILYEAESGERRGETVIPGDGLSFSPDGKIFASYYYGRAGLKLWRSETVTPIVQSVEGQLTGFSEDSKLLVTTRTNDGVSEVLIWNARDDTGEPLRTFTYPGTLNPNSGVRLQQNNTVLTAFGNAGTFVWDLTNLSPEKPISEDTFAVDRMLFSHDGKTLATRGTDGIVLWDVTHRSAMGPPLTGHTGHIADLAFSKDSNSVVYVDADGSIFELDLANAENASGNSTLLKRFRNACRLVLSPDGSRLAYKSGRKLFVWDVTNKADLAEWDENISCDGKIAFSEDGNTLTYSDGNHIYMYPFGSTAEAPKPVDPTGVRLFNRVNDLTFVLDDRILAGTGDDGRVFFWDAKSRTLLGTLNQSGRIERVANGKFQVYMPSENRMILIDFATERWQESLKKWRTDLCEKVGRNLTQTEVLQYFSGQYLQGYNGTCLNLPVESPPAR